MRWRIGCRIRASAVGQIAIEPVVKHAIIQLGGKAIITNGSEVAGLACLTSNARAGCERERLSDMPIHIRIGSRTGVVIDCGAELSQATQGIFQQIPSIAIHIKAVVLGGRGKPCTGIRTPTRF